MKFNSDNVRQVSQEVLLQEVVLVLRSAWRSKDSFDQLKKIATISAEISIDSILGPLEEAIDATKVFDAKAKLEKKSVVAAARKTLIAAINAATGGGGNPGQPPLEQP